MQLPGNWCSPHVLHRNTERNRNVRRVLSSANSWQLCRDPDRRVHILPYTETLIRCRSGSRWLGTFRREIHRRLISPDDNCSAPMTTLRWPPPRRRWNSRSEYSCRLNSQSAISFLDSAIKIQCVNVSDYKTITTAPSLLWGYRTYNKLL